jgi:DNA-binding MarR family transcriptional regulator
MIQLNPMDVAGCTCANLRKATRVVTQVYDQALAPVGLRATQFTLLATLAQTGDAAVTRLAEALVMDRTTLTRNLKPLIARGLIRVGQERDQRVRQIHLTDDGMKLFDRARPAWEEAQARLVEGLGATRWAGLLDDLSLTVGVARGE